MKKLILILTSAFLLTSCAQTVNMPVSYTAQSFANLEGIRASLGEFTYRPYIDAIAKSNQITNTAAGTIIIPEDVSTYVRRATGIELRNAGADLENKSISIEGEVIKFEVDDFGYSADWYFTLKYTIVNTLTGEEVFSKIYNSKPRNTGKFALPADFVPIINSIILDCVEQFMTDLKKLYK